MSLHYLVKPKMLIRHVLPLSCQRKKFQNLFHLNSGPQIREIWIQFITACGNYCKRKCTKYTSLIWTNWKSDRERSGPSSAKSSFRQPFVSGVTPDQIAPDQFALCTISCNISQILLSTEFKYGEFGGHSWDGINSGVSI